MKGSELLGSLSVDFTLSDFYDEDITEDYSSELTYSERKAKYRISRTQQNAALVLTENQHYKTDSMLSHISWSSRLYMNLVLLAGFCVISLPRLSRVTLEEKSSVGVR